VDRRSASTQRPRSTRRAFGQPALTRKYPRFFGANDRYRGQGSLGFRPRSPSTRISESGGTSSAVSPDLSQNLRDVLEPSDQRRRQGRMPATNTSAKMEQTSAHRMLLLWRSRPARLAKKRYCSTAKNKRAEAEVAGRRPAVIASNGWAGRRLELTTRKFAHEDAEAEERPAIATTTEHEDPSRARGFCPLFSPPISAIFLCAF